jgi:murein DD-endopeptidase MepM/ murein hydrolase activator NlpD
VDESAMQAPDSTALPVDEMDAQKIVSDVLDPEPVIPAEPDFDTLTLKVSRGDTMEKLFRKNNLDIGNLMTIAQLEEARQLFRRIKPGDVFEVEHDEGEIVSLYSKLDLTSGLKIGKQDDGFTAQLIEYPIEVRKRSAYGVIESSLYESAASAGLSDKVIMNIAGIFAWDVDFVQDIRKGDNYYVQYEEIWQDGKFVTDGEIIVAEFNNNGRTSRAVRFVDQTGRTDYFTPEGHSVRKAFLRSPVDFRVSSSFNPNRLHPVLKTRRPHRGVDYAAPRGTPIKASGDGKVIFRGVQNGYGNTVILQHGGNITTLYAHMSKFASKVRVGTRVRQGQTIGYVGATGLVSGVHLHYEYRLNGVHRNPRTIKLPQADPIAAEYREQFLSQAAPILRELEKFKSTQVASVAYSAQ